MYDYHDTEIRAERLAAGRDHCSTPGPVHDLAKLLSRERIADPEGSGDLTTTATRRLIYAVGRDLKIHVGFDGERGAMHAVKHETLFHNDPVQAAGEMRVIAGVVVEINDRSGSYGTTGLMRVDRRMALAVLTALKLSKVPLSDGVLDYLNAQAGP